MNERLKEVRKHYGLNQAEFAARLGVQSAAISRYEKGDRGISEQVILAVCREYNVSENWLRTGEGEMRIATKDALIQQMADVYNLDALDVAYVEGYLNLPEAQKASIKTHLLNVARSYSLHGADVDFAEEIAIVVDEAERRKFEDFNRPLTIDEKTELCRQRLIAQEKGVANSTIYGNPQTGTGETG